MIGDKIVYCREKVGMTQEVLADRLNVSQQEVSGWETGEIMPDIEKIIQLSKLFHVSTDYFLMDGMEELQEQENPIKERRRDFRIFFGKFLLIAGLIVLVGTLIGAGIYSEFMTEWYTAWGKYGTALFRSWCIVPLILSFCMTVVGGNILWEEYKRED
ncbi:helix-turn-helix domain-containing protein [Faecalimonas umbilicata]|nr:helix-turn-helix domain-containing protein [Faecalimonas umbilicata]